MKACIDNSCAGLAGAFGPSLRQPAGGRGAQVDRIGRRRAGKLWKLLCEAEGTAPVAPQSRRCTVTRELAALAQSPFQGAARGTRPRASSRLGGTGGRQPATNCSHAARRVGGCAPRTHRGCGRSLGSYGTVVAAWRPVAA